MKGQIPLQQPQTQSQPPSVPSVPSCSNPLSRILHEPLLHFLLLGLALFAASTWLTRKNAPEPAKIIISQSEIASLIDNFTRTWQRPPTTEELNSLIADRVREEVYSRQAVTLGLDRDDGIIRRRLRQKMEFLTEDIIAASDPTDADLNTYLQAHPDAFRVEQTFTFSQVYLNPQKHPGTLPRDAAQLLTQINQAGLNPDLSELGDSFLLDHTFTDLPAAEVTKQFGDEFAAKLATLPLHHWQGPIPSGYGTHLVLVRQRTEGRLPSLAEVRPAVLRDWTNARRTQANEDFYTQLLKQYEVIIESPDSKAPTQPPPSTNK